MNENESNASSTTRSPNIPGIYAAIDHMLARKVDALLWFTRIGTVVFTFFCILPLFGINPYTSYQRALLCNAATSALRLHQRLPRVQFTREFGVMLMMEDSCHYLLYSLLFIYSYPVTLALLPISLFAFLHSVNYSLSILNKLGQFHSWLTRTLMSIVEHHQRNILRFVALNEVCLLPLMVFMTFSGRGSLFTPFAYYRFLTLRYTSRRNPYTRTVFRELRLIVENFGNTPGRSESLKYICHRIIVFSSWFAPIHAPHQ